MIDPSAALQNFKRIAQAGGEARYGFYEALDYTEYRVPEGKDVASCTRSWRTIRACRWCPSPTFWRTA